MTDTWFAGHNAERDEYIDKLQARITELENLACQYNYQMLKAEAVLKEIASYEDSAGIADIARNALSKPQHTSTLVRDVLRYRYIRSKDADSSAVTHLLHTRVDTEFDAGIDELMGERK